MVPSTQTNNKINEYDFSALDELAPKQVTLNEAFQELIFYVLPILAFLFFLFVLFNGVIPSIQDMNTRLDEIEKLRVEDAALNDRIQKIRALENNINNMQAVIDKIDSLIPTGRTEVVAFGERIIANITDTGLVYDELKTGELEIVSSTSYIDPAALINMKDDPTYLPLYSLPTTFNVTGPYESIRTFFINMYKGQDFFVVDEMELTKNSDTAWSGDISLAKYQFTENPSFDPFKAYFSISEDSPLNQEVIDFLEKKYVDLVIEQKQD